MACGRYQSNARLWDLAERINGKHPAMSWPPRGGPLHVQSRPSKRSAAGFAEGRYASLNFTPVYVGFRAAPVAACATELGRQRPVRIGRRWTAAQEVGGAPPDNSPIAASIAATASSRVRRAVSTTSLGEVHGT